MGARGRGGKRSERGAILLVLLAALTITSILSAVAVQEWSEIARRDNEAEMIFRAQEIVRALKKYRGDRGQLPTKLDQLIEPGSRGQYFLRHLYKDPLVKGGKWGLLYMGPGGGIVDPSVQPIDGALPGAGGGPGGGLTGGGSSLGAGLSKLNPPVGQQQQGGAQGDVVTSALSASGETTGLPIAGVKTLCKDRPFRVYREHEEYEEWLFTILDLEPKQVGQPGQPGQPGGGIGNPGTAKPNPGGSTKPPTSSGD